MTRAERLAIIVAQIREDRVAAGAPTGVGEDRLIEAVVGEYTAFAESIERIAAALEVVADAARALGQPEPILPPHL